MYYIFTIDILSIYFSLKTLVLSSTRGHIWNPSARRVSSSPIQTFLISYCSTTLLSIFSGKKTFRFTMASSMQRFWWQLIFYRLFLVKPKVFQLFFKGRPSIWSRQLRRWIALFGGYLSGGQMSRTNDSRSCSQKQRPRLWNTTASPYHYLALEPTSDRIMPAMLL